MEDVGVRRASKIGDEGEGIDGVLMAGAQHAHQDLLRASTVGGSTPSPHLADHRRRPDCLLGAVVRRVQPRTLQVREQEFELPVEMSGESAILLRPIVWAQEPLELGLQSAGGYDQAVFGYLPAGKAIPQSKSLLQDGLDLEREAHRRYRSTLDDSIAAVDDVAIAALLVGPLEHAIAGRPVAYQETIKVCPQQLRR